MDSSIERKEGKTRKKSSKTQDSAEVAYTNTTVANQSQNGEVDEQQQNIHSKKTHKIKPEDAAIVASNSVSEHDDEYQRSKKKSKKQFKEKDEAELVAAAQQREEDGRLSESFPEKKRKHSKDDTVDQQQDATAAATAASSYNAKLKNTLMTRAERSRRETQKQTQEYVASLREKGITDKKELKRLKNKMSKKSHNVSQLKKAGKYIEPTEVDIHINCQDCHASFNFIVKEQLFYNKMKFPFPIRCKPCQSAKKERMGDDVTK